MSNLGKWIYDGCQRPSERTNTMSKYDTPKTTALTDRHASEDIDHLMAWTQMMVLARQLERALRAVVESPHFYDMDGLIQELVNSALELPPEPAIPAPETPLESV